MSSKQVKAILFDFGNVLIDWNPRYIYKHYFPDDPEGMEEFLDEIKFMEWNVYQDKGRPFAEGVAALSEQFPQHAELIRAYHERWPESLGEAFWGTVEILEKVKAAGYPVFGFSNWSTETFHFARQKHTFFELLDDILLSGAVGHVKPEPEIYQLMLEKVGRPAEECLFIDDSLANIQQAQQLGFHTVHFQSPEQLESELNARGIL